MEEDLLCTVVEHWCVSHRHCLSDGAKNYCCALTSTIHLGLTPVSLSAIFSVHRQAFHFLFHMFPHTANWWGRLKFTLHFVTNFKFGEALLIYNLPLIWVKQLPWGSSVFCFIPFRFFNSGPESVLPFLLNPLFAHHAVRENGGLMIQSRPQLQQHERRWGEQMKAANTEFKTWEEHRNLEQRLQIIGVIEKARTVGSNLRVTSNITSALSRSQGHDILRSIMCSGQNGGRIEAILYTWIAQWIICTLRSQFVP